MALQSLNHVNIQTANLGEMETFYQEILGLEVGWRPSFSFRGAWLYCKEQAVIHLVEVASPVQVQGVQIEHFAFLSTGLEQFLSRLKACQIAYQDAVVPDTNAHQVNIYDPDGNHIEVQFAAEDATDLD